MWFARNQIGFCKSALPAIGRWRANGSSDDLCLLCLQRVGEVWAIQRKGMQKRGNSFIKKKIKKNLPSPGKCLIFPWQFSDLLQSSQRWCQTNPVSVFGGRCSPQSMPKCLGQKVAKVCKWQGYVSCRWEIASYMGIVRTELQWEQLRK